MAKLLSMLTCQHHKEEAMPSDVCLWFYKRDGCAVVLKPSPEDCGDYCSFGTLPCPSVQDGSNYCA